MKMNKLGTGAVATQPKLQPFTDEQRAKLSGKSINQALEEGILTEVCNDKGEFIFKHSKAEVERLYAVFGRNYCGISAAVEDIYEDATDDELGELVFYSNTSRKKYLNGAEDEEGEHVSTFTLGMAGGLNIGDSVKTIGATVAAGN